MDDRDRIVSFTESEEEKKVCETMETLYSSIHLFRQKIHDELGTRDKSIETLKDNLLSLEREFRDTNQRLEMVQQDKDSLETGKENCEKKLQRSEQECRDLREELDRTKNSLRAMEVQRKENESLKEEKYVLLQEIESLRSEIKKIEGLHAGKIEDMNNQFQQEKNKLQDIQCSLEDRIRNLTDLNSEESAARERLNREKRAIVEEMDRVNSEKKEIREHFARQIASLKDQLKVMERRAQDDLRDLEQRARKELMDLEREKSSRITALEKELGQKQREMSLKDHRLAQLESEHARKLELAKKEFESRMALELDEMKRKYYLELEKARSGGRWSGGEEKDS
ncbi:MULTISPECIES: hypothetical protein [Dethiosulfovibrio]|uniref:Uncharacterized protein n=2 Tax=Dethiosulfovibrio TaxID=47054 RepID=A0ABS9ERZ0_9BACT|nr:MULTISPECIES: hypothetical protein [Dethiosulfovibrio]MCF4114284.1 hypothetical protein [Dethiosulfovibrio russensis]MCF4143276.1 hypothetical protein [Dethiosulfovibrio marinus]MCF4145445.1 hypothetical protein [Dethiosulfovibrio acidaminovorans]